MSGIRLSFLDGLRGIAALIVVVHHAFMAYVPALYSGAASESRFPWDIWLSGQPFLLLFFAGNFAVCIFFVLSGFVLAHVFSQTSASPLELMVRRYVRLGVPILASNLVMFIIGTAALIFIPLQRYIPAMPGAQDLMLTDRNIASALYECVYEALIQAPIFGIKAPTFNGVLWTMQVEFIGSFLLIGVFMLARLIAPSRISAAAALICLCLIAVAWLSQLSLFMIGAIIYWAYGTREPARSVRAELFGASLIIAGVYFGTMPESGMRPEFTNVLIRLTGMDMPSLYAKTLFNWAPLPLLPIMLWHAIGATILLVGVFHSSLARRFLSNKIALFLGFVSFPLYLLQVPAKALTADPMRHFLLSHGVAELAALFLAVIVATAAAIGVAYVFARTVEVRSIKWSGIAGKFIATTFVPSTPWPTGDVGQPSSPNAVQA